MTDPHAHLLTLSEDDGEFVTIPRLAEYYRPGTPVVGWGTIPEGFRIDLEASDASAAPQPRPEPRTG